MCLELDVATSELSLHHRTCHLETEPSTASFSMGNYNCFWNSMMEDGTCHSTIGLVTLKLGLRPSLILKERTHCVWTWMLGHWTCHSSIGPVILKLGLRPSFKMTSPMLECQVQCPSIQVHTQCVLSLRIKLGQHPSPETNIISH